VGVEVGPWLASADAWLLPQLLSVAVGAFACSVAVAANPLLAGGIHKLHENMASFPTAVELVLWMWQVAVAAGLLV